MYHLTINRVHKNCRSFNYALEHNMSIMIFRSIGHLKNPCVDIAHNITVNIVKRKHNTGEIIGYYHIFTRKSNDRICR